MSAPQNFRSAFNGFNREDVVHYLEYLNARHASQINQLNSEADFLRNKVQAMQPDLSLIQERDALLSRVAELEARCSELELQLAAAQSAPIPEPAQPLVSTTSDELEAYRRAERTERMARERAELVYHQVSGVLAEATTKVDGTAAQIAALAEQVMIHLTQLQNAVSDSKEALQDAASTMNAIKPNS